ncbi:uncharacterized protein AB9W97_003502 isoform 1-T1 [Spinachia spinachia]
MVETLALRLMLMLAGLQADGGYSSTDQLGSTESLRLSKHNMRLMLKRHKVRREGRHPSRGAVRQGTQRPTNRHRQSEPHHTDARQEATGRGSHAADATSGCLSLG